MSHEGLVPFELHKGNTFLVFIQRKNSPLGRQAVQVVRWAEKGAQVIAFKAIPEKNTP